MRSFNGTASSAASCKTLLLKDSQLRSRMIVFRLCKTVVVDFQMKLTGNRFRL